MMATWTEAAAVVGCFTGIGGLFLGVLNYLHQRSTQAVRLTIRYRSIDDEGRQVDGIHPRYRAAVQICNDSAFPVRLVDVGVCVTKPQKEFLQLESPETIDLQAFPLVLPAKLACTVPIGGLNSWELAARDICRAYVRTDSGREFRAPRAALSASRAIGGHIRAGRAMPKTTIVARVDRTDA